MSAPVELDDDTLPEAPPAPPRPPPVPGPGVGLSLFPAPARWSTHAAWNDLPFDDVVARLRDPELWPGEGAPSSAPSRLPAWSTARFRDDARLVMRDEALAHQLSGERVVSVSGLWVEYEDEPTVGVDHLHLWWPDVAFVAYTTAYHDAPLGERPPGPRWRLLVPFVHPVSADVARRVADWARHPRHAAGMIAASTADVHRAVEVPAMAPGGYRWTCQSGPALDPDAALTELEAWRRLDHARRAEEALRGTRLEDAALAFRRRLADPHRAALFPIPGCAPPRPTPRPAPPPPTTLPRLGALAEGLWPGRLGTLLGASGSGRTALALALAAAAAADGRPVLFVLLRMSADDLVARLLSGATGWRTSDLMRGAHDATDVDAALRERVAALPGLHVWMPAAAERTRDHLERRARAMSDAHRGAAPLLVIDAVEGWGDGDALAAALRDVSHPGGLGEDWPGAAVWMVADLPASSHVSIGGTASLVAAWKSGALAELQRGGVQGESSLVFVVAKDNGHDGGVSPAVVVVAKNREGATGVVRLRLDNRTGRFEETDEPTS